MMGGQFSKKRNSNTPSPSQQINTSSQYTVGLSSYVDACKLDPDLQVFDTSVNEKTSLVINTLATGVEVRSTGMEFGSLSFDSLKDVTNCLLEMNQEVVKVILECKKDIWNNQNLFGLVEEYFESSVQTLDFCNALENCVKRARNSQLIIQVAIKQFEEEIKLDGEAVEKKYEKTLEELHKFKAAGDPFTEEFFTLFQSVYQQQLSMFQKLQLRKRKLDKKLKSMKGWRRVSNVLFVVAFASVLILSVVAAAIAAPPVVTALAGALTIPIGSVGKWCSSLWNSYEKALKEQRQLISSMQIGTFLTIKDMDNIRALANKLEMEIESLLQNADLALVEDDAVRLVMDEIKNKLGVFMETIENLGEHAGKCSRQIGQARTVILQRIIRYSEH